MEVTPTILVVDDEEAIRDSCRQILERSRYRSRPAADGAEGLRALQRKRVDLVLLDLRMPGLDGTEFLQRVREQFSELDVIGHHRILQRRLRRRLHAPGAYDYLPKPFDAESLRLAVSRALEKRRLALENLALRRRLREVSRQIFCSGAAGDPKGAGDDHTGGPGRDDGTDPGGERHRQGIGGARHPTAPRPGGTGFPHGRLRRAGRVASRERAVRARKGAYTGAVTRAPVGSS